MESLNHDPAIDKEIKRLSLRIALCRYDLQQAIYQNVPLGMLKDLCTELAVCQIQKCALINGHWKELPYPVRLLYTNQKP
jgi:hypothetical protein